MIFDDVFWSCGWVVVSVFMVRVGVLCVFFFQAEDGIRDLVRSRGLGDVYKRQSAPGRLLLSAMVVLLAGSCMDEKLEPTTNQLRFATDMVRFETAVSYTHLTLPTSDLV